ncbi:tail completion protein gp17 [Microbispora rosea]|uniref:tail completion protein gp17 n=1 Tax=Microbispora rosea TaxID=58117 RepID=UPI00379B38A4
MSDVIAASGPHTDAVLAALEAAEVLVGRSVSPPGGGWQGEPGHSDYVPYAVVYPSPGVPDGNIAEPLTYLDYSAQISCWGTTASQVEVVADQVRAALVGKRLTVPGRSTYPVQQPPGSVPVQRFDQPPPAVFRAVVEIAFRSQAR